MYPKRTDLTQPPGEDAPERNCENSQMVLDPYLYDKDKPCISFDTTGKRSIFRDLIRLCEKRGNTSGDTCTSSTTKNALAKAQARSDGFQNETNPENKCKTTCPYCIRSTVVVGTAHRLHSFTPKHVSRQKRRQGT